MKLRYLVVDDAPFIRELLKSILTQMGHLCVGEADTGKEAVELVMKTLPDVVFLDLVMPKMNGVQTAKELNDVWPEVKIIACTTLTIDDLQKPQDQELFAGWIEKPFDQGKIAQTLDEALRTSVEAKP